MTLIATPGAANANSFATEVEATTFIAAHPYGDEWLSSAKPKEPWLRLATMRHDRLRWRGSRVTTTQALSWPRNGVMYFDTDSFTLGDAMAYGQGGVLIPNTIIPAWLRDATSELARILFSTLSDDPSFWDVEEVRLADLALKMRGSSMTGTLPASVQAMIAPYVLAGIGIQKRLVRM